MKTVDINSQPVRVGSKVKVLNISSETISSLLKEEVPFVKSMIKDILEIDEIDEFACAWVEKLWQIENGECITHSISLESNHMELISY